MPLRIIPHGIDHDDDEEIDERDDEAEPEADRRLAPVRRDRELRIRSARLPPSISFIVK